MKTIADALVPGGIFIAYVPAFDCLWTNMDDSVGHIRRYSIPEMRQLVESSGLLVQHIGYTDFLGFFATIAFRFMSNNNDDVGACVIGFYDKWIFPASHFVDRVTRGVVLGKNLIVIAKKDK